MKKFIYCHRFHCGLEIYQIIICYGVIYLFVLFLLFILRTGSKMQIIRVSDVRYFITLFIYDYCTTYSQVIRIAAQKTITSPKPERIMGIFPFLLAIFWLIQDLHRTR